MNNAKSESLERQMTAVLARLDAAERRLRVTWVVAIVCCLAAFLLGLNPDARAQVAVTLSNVNARLKTVEKELPKTRRVIETQNEKIAALEKHLAEQNQKEEKPDSLGNRLANLEIKVANIQNKSGLDANRAMSVENKAANLELKFAMLENKIATLELKMASRP